MSTSVPPVSGDTQKFDLSLPHYRTIGTLWRRVIAFIVDGIVIGIIGAAIAFPLFDAFSRLGAWARLVGFCVALPYFAVLNSKIGNGQTLGKRLMHLQVVNKDGKTISFWQSVLRYALLSAPDFLNGLTLPASRTPWIIFSIAGLVVFGLGGATLYLVIFNRHSRQGIHDLAVGSYVVDADEFGAPNVQPIWRPHLWLLGCSLVSVWVGTEVFGSKLVHWGPFPQMLQDVQSIEAMPQVQSAGEQEFVITNSRDGRLKRLVVTIRWTGRAEDRERFADSVARLVLKQNPKVKEHDAFRVVLIRGFDLGICHGQVSYPFEHTPAQWSNRLSEESPAKNAVAGSSD